MDGAEKHKTVITSATFQTSLLHVMNEGIERFGLLQANRYLNKIERLVKGLGDFYPYHPECRHLATKSRMYRNIILDAHLIIYRIGKERIEVLDIVHAASSLRRIRDIRKIKI